MAEAGNRAQPRSLTLMAGPIDTRQQSDQGQRTGEVAADRVVREEADRQGAVALQGRVPAGLSGVPAADGVHER